LPEEEVAQEKVVLLESGGGGITGVKGGEQTSLGSAWARTKAQQKADSRARRANSRAEVDILDVAELEEGTGLFWPAKKWMRKGSGKWAGVDVLGT
jgi:hypothetical protein